MPKWIQDSTNKQLTEIRKKMQDMKELKSIEILKNKIKAKFWKWKAQCQTKNSADILNRLP
jgi:hypothetical protein